MNAKILKGLRFVTLAIFCIGGLGRGTNLYALVIIPIPPPPFLINITIPTTQPIFTNFTKTIDIGGGFGHVSASSVTWNNDLGISGAASFNDWSWGATGIVLHADVNVLTVTGTSYSGPASANLQIIVPRPTVYITTPHSGECWSNTSITFNGTASSKSEIAAVYCQLNNGDWINANGTTNWSVTYNLPPSTNTMKVYATDGNGFTSLSNSVSFDCVVLNQLNIKTNGMCKITPNLSSKWLEIGKSFCVTCTPSAHFTFSNWESSTNNWGNGTKTSNNILSFVMQSNLTLQANFVETAKPTITVKSPVANQRTTNSLIVIKGKASDVWGVSNVWYQVNNGVWIQAVTTNNWKDWTGSLQLQAGTNKVQAYSVNLGGKTSPIKSFIVKSTKKFQLQFNLEPAKRSGINRMGFSLVLPSGLNGTIEVSTDLVHWQTLTNVMGSDSNIDFYDSEFQSHSQRFYRAATKVP